MLYYKVIEYSSDGLTLESKIIDYLVIPQTVMELSISIPGMKQYKVKVRVTTARESEDTKDGFNLGVNYINPDPEFLEAVSIFLLKHPGEPITLKNLKENNFIVPFDLSKVLVCRYVSSRRDLEDYLELRLSAQKGEGRWLEESDRLMTVDEFDSRSRKVMFKIGTQTVAIGRLVFHEKDQMAEHDNLVDIPEYIRKEKFLEASRFATNPEFRGANLFVSLMMQVMKIAVENQAKYVLCNSEDSLVKIYARFGTKPLGRSFRTDFMEDVNLNLMVADVNRCIRLKDVSIFLGLSLLESFFPYMKSRHMTLASKGIVGYILEHLPRLELT